ncbi:hypothetical protein L3Y34_016199 [Caenorhabditis briggsae]|uniref:F-box domain-containing protein n=1 Tax=Caenorhabditis briggsae TaxID=6238 RepID=A0AAE9DX11_CAEBR|nr:hypothetical protein L3Y34_016199 [Caenorhabditis briggsae]
MSRLPILRLPDLVLEEVFKEMDPFKLIEFAKCSKRLHPMIRRIGKKFELSVDLYCKQINIYTPDKRQWPVYFYSLESEQENAKFVKTECPTRDICIHLFEFLLYFGCRKIRHFETCPETIFNTLPIVKLLVHFKCSVKNVTFRMYKTEGDVFKEILTSLKVTDMLSIGAAVEFPPTFEFKFVFYPKFLYIQNSHWIKMDQLFKAANRCLKISLKKSSLTNEDLDRFLRRWQSGKLRRMKMFYFTVQGKQINDKSTIFDMEIPIKSEDDKCVHERDHEGYQETVRRGVVFKNVEGQRAVIHFDPPRSSAFSFMLLD